MPRGNFSLSGDENFYRNKSGMKIHCFQLKNFSGDGYGVQIFPFNFQWGWNYRTISQWFLRQMWPKRNSETNVYRFKFYFIWGKHKGLKQFIECTTVFADVTRGLTVLICQICRDCLYQKVFIKILPPYMFASWCTLHSLFLLSYLSRITTISSKCFAAKKGAIMWFD